MANGPTLGELLRRDQREAAREAEANIGPVAWSEGTAYVLRYGEGSRRDYAIMGGKKVYWQEGPVYVWACVMEPEYTALPHVAAALDEYMDYMP